MVTGEQTQSKNRVQTERKREQKVNECTENDMRMQMNDYLTLYMYFTGNQEKITNKLPIYIVISLNIRLSLL